MFKTKFKTGARPTIGMLSVVLSLVGTASCVDDKYDLDKDIDMTVNVGGAHLAIPVGSTEQIMLKKIIKPEDSDMLTTINDVYHLEKRGTMDGTSTEVKTVEVDGAEVSIDNVSIVSEDNIPETGSDYRNDQISQNGTFETSATHIDEAVKEIGTLTAATAAKLTIKFTLDGPLGYDEVQVEELKITLPEILMLGNADANLNDNADVKDHVLTVTGEHLQPGASFQRVLDIEGYTFLDTDDKGIVINNQRLDISEQVEVTGKVTVKNIHGSGELSFKPEITISSMTVNHMFGLAQPTIDPVETSVELDDIPDFLQDDAVELDILNPVFKFVAKNPLNTEIVLDGTLLGMKDGKEVSGSQVHLGEGYTTPITLEPNSESTIALVRQTGTTVEGATQTIIVNNAEKSNDINNIIRKIPDDIKVELTPSVKSTEYYDIALGQTYEINDPTYDIDMPLEFGKNLTIVYNDSICDLSGDLDDIDFTRANILMTADNTIPLNLEITSENVVLKDAAGKKIDGITVTVEKGIITESKDGKTIVTSQLTINLQETVAEAIQRLDRIDFKVTAVPGQAAEQPLKSTQWLQLRDMKLNLPDGIKIDLN